MRSEQAAPLLAPLLEEERYSSWHLVEPDGHLLNRAAAGIRLLTHLGAGSVATAAGRMEPLPTTLYELVARHRSGLGRLVPDGPPPFRFP